MASQWALLDPEVNQLGLLPREYLEPFSKWVRSTVIISTAEP